MTARSVLMRSDNFFDGEEGAGPNKGASVDQDGKSNIWAVEPKMRDEVTGEGDGFKKIAVIGGGAVAAAVLVIGIVNILPNPDLI